MSDDEHHDVHFEAADAGASMTYPQQAGTIRKNGFIVIKNRPCKVQITELRIMSALVSYLRNVWNLIGEPSFAKCKPSPLGLDQKMIYAGRRCFYIKDRKARTC